VLKPSVAATFTTMTWPGSTLLTRRRAAIINPEVVKLILG
jgi:hypothetical protein